MNLRETEVMGKGEEESERGERREKKEGKNKKEIRAVIVGNKKIVFGLRFLLQ